MFLVELAKALWRDKKFILDCQFLGLLPDRGDIVNKRAACDIMRDFAIPVEETPVTNAVTSKNCKTHC